MSLRLILLIAAFICFALAAISRRVAINTDIDLVATGLALWVLTLIVPGD
jgi:ABC-type uncharacterized transport system permease subunit